MTPCPFCGTPSPPRAGILRWCDPCGRWWGPSDVLEQRDRARDVAVSVVESEGAWQAVAERLAAALQNSLGPPRDSFDNLARLRAAHDALTAFDDLRGRVAT